MTRGEYLDYDGELIDDGSLLTVQYGSKWAAYLLAAAASLVEPDIWNPLDDVELAVEQANELIVRLMGMEELTVQKMAVLPIEIPVLGMLAPLPEAADWIIRNTTYYFSSAILSKNDNWQEDWVHFEVFLEAGTYYMYLFSRRSPGSGKVKLRASGEIGLSGTVWDLYRATQQNEYVWGEGFTVVSDGVYVFTLEKHLKNPASANCRITLNGVVIRG